MELTTDRLVLRPWAEGDLDTLLAIRNAPEVIGTTYTGEPLPRECMAGQLGRRSRRGATAGSGPD